MAKHFCAPMVEPRTSASTPRQVHEPFWTFWRIRFAGNCFFALNMAPRTVVILVVPASAPRYPRIRPLFHAFGPGMAQRAGDQQRQHVLDEQRCIARCGFARVAGCSCSLACWRCGAMHCRQAGLRVLDQCPMAQMAPFSHFLIRR
jgi:hypothetical protein